MPEGPHPHAVLPLALCQLDPPLAEAPLAQPRLVAGAELHPHVPRPLRLAWCARWRALDRVAVVLPAQAERERREVARRVPPRRRHDHDLARPLQAVRRARERLDPIVVAAARFGRPWPRRRQQVPQLEPRDEADPRKAVVGHRHALVAAQREHQRAAAAPQEGSGAIHLARAFDGVQQPVLRRCAVQLAVVQDKVHVGAIMRAQQPLQPHERRPAALLIAVEGRTRARAHHALAQHSVLTDGREEAVRRVPLGERRPADQPAGDERRLREVGGQLAGGIPPKRVSRDALARQLLLLGELRRLVQPEVDAIGLLQVHPWHDRFYRHLGRQPRQRHRASIGCHHDLLLGPARLARKLLSAGRRVACAALVANVAVELCEQQHRAHVSSLSGSDRFAWRCAHLRARVHAVRLAAGVACES
eukprot:1561350-Prymnesium_polylepis.2